MEVVPPCDGLVVSAGGKALPELSPTSPSTSARLRLRLRPRRPAAGTTATPPDSDRPGDPPGRAGQDGPEDRRARQGGLSGGWSHLHFDIKSRQPSGKWGIQEGYAFLWEAYQREHKPQLIAVARPHHLVWAGEKVILDGSRSWSAAGKIARYEWTFTDGTAATGPTRRAHVSHKPGEYSEILKVDRRRRAGSTTTSPWCTGHRQALDGSSADDPRRATRRPSASARATRSRSRCGRSRTSPRAGDVGLRRRQPAGDGPVGRQRQAAGPGRLRRDGPPLRRSRATTWSGSSGRTTGERRRRTCRCGSGRSKGWCRGGRASARREGDEVFG